MSAADYLNKGNLRSPSQTGTHVPPSPVHTSPLPVAPYPSDQSAELASYPGATVVGGTSGMLGMDVTEVTAPCPGEDASLPDLSAMTLVARDTRAAQVGAELTALKRRLAAAEDKFDKASDEWEAERLSLEGSVEASNTARDTMGRQVAQLEGQLVRLQQEREQEQAEAAKREEADSATIRALRAGGAGGEGDGALSEWKRVAREEQCRAEAALRQMEKVLMDSIEQRSEALEARETSVGEREALAVELIEVRRQEASLRQDLEGERERARVAEESLQTLQGEESQMDVRLQEARAALEEERELRKGAEAQIVQLDERVLILSASLEAVKDELVGAEREAERKERERETETSEAASAAQEERVSAMQARITSLEVQLSLAADELEAEDTRQRREREVEAREAQAAERDAGVMASVQEIMSTLHSLYPSLGTVPSDDTETDAPVSVVSMLDRLGCLAAEWVGERETLTRQAAAASEAIQSLDTLTRQTRDHDSSHAQALAEARAEAATCRAEAVSARAEIGCGMQREQAQAAEMQRLTGELETLRVRAQTAGGRADRLQRELRDMKGAQAQMEREREQEAHVRAQETISPTLETGVLVRLQRFLRHIEYDHAWPDAIRRALEGDKAEVHLSIMEGTKQGDLAAACLSAYAPGLGGVTHLSVSGNGAKGSGMHSAGFTHLSDALGHMGQLTEMNLRGNVLKLEGGISLSLALADSTSLRTLRLEGNGMSPSAALALVPGLALCPSLSHLDVVEEGSPYLAVLAARTRYRPLFSAHPGLVPIWHQFLATHKKACTKKKQGVVLKMDVAGMEPSEVALLRELVRNVGENGVLQPL
ncbi:hypothetical protein KIPB_000360 [Kipferlia bialata]|uniref:Uncharacterized protein n=1 Tax=Kipferlia bialata TaxID=797122 RepID=A0A9K3CM80_9EUKA|nr:hypothetical protein KIPB_000360 [Kipferlia bialata]|eukprot:g360.t1